MLGANSLVKKGAALNGSVIIGDNCVIEAGCVISDSVIWSGAEIGSEANLARCVIGSRYKVKPSSKLVDTVAVAQELAV